MMVSSSKKPFHYQQVVLVILDGWGHREDNQHNAIAQAKTPFFDSLWKNSPHSLLGASQHHVGLPSGVIGNSEIGHMTIGTGKTIDTDLVRISKAMRNNEFSEITAFKQLFAHIKKHNSSLHVLGMVSPAGVHSHQEHLHGFLKAAKDAGLTKVIIHAFTDGRDSPPRENHKYLEELEKVIEDLGIGYIATATGRYFAMDRDKNWHRTEKAEKALFEGEGRKVKAQKPSQILNKLHKEGEMDEYLEPIIFLDETGQSFPISDNDGIFFFNYRIDRPRQLSYKIMERAKKQNLFFATMTEYDPRLESVVAFPPTKIDASLAEEVSEAGLSQARIAETEKYGHITYYFNGGQAILHKNEEHFLIDSHRDVATHDQAPEMRATEIADKAVESLEKGVNFIALNFANADMVGHTANVPAIIKAAETVDANLKRIVEKAKQKNAAVLITADHGNAEINLDAERGVTHTAHTTNPVPAILTVDGIKLRDGTLADIAPTILELFNLPKPTSMTGESLIQN